MCKNRDTYGILGPSSVLITYNICPPRKIIRYTEIMHTPFPVNTAIRCKRVGYKAEYGQLLVRGRQERQFCQAVTVSINR